MIEIYPGLVVNIRRIIAVFVDKQEYTTKVVMLMEKGVRQVIINDVSNEKMLEKIMQSFKDKANLKEINSYLLIKGEVFFEIKLEDGSILYNIEGENIKIKF